MHAGIYPEVPDDFGHWLAGFIDGEGCFLIVRDRRNSRRDYYHPHFRLCLRSDDLAVLEECRRVTGIGRLHHDADPGHDGHDRKPQVRWWAFTHTETVRLAELLDRYPLRSKKQRDFAIWAQAARLKSLIQPYRGGNPRRGGRAPHSANDHIWARLATLYDQLIDIRRWREHDSALVPEPVQDQSVPTGCDLSLF